MRVNLYLGYYRRSVRTTRTRHLGCNPEEHRLHSVTFIGIGKLQMSPGCLAVQRGSVPCDNSSGGCGSDCIVEFIYSGAHDCG